MSSLSAIEKPDAAAISVMIQLGRSLLQSGRVGEAEQALELGVLLAETEGPPASEAAGTARFDLANLLYSRGRHAEAALQYQELISRIPSHTEAHYNLGVTEVLCGRVPEAAAAYRRALALNPDHANAHNNLAMLLQSFGSDDASRAEALAHFRASNSPEARYNRALILQEQGEVEEASSLYRALLEENPDYHEARNNLANIALAQGRTQYALEQYQRILQVLPDFAEAHRNTAMAQLILGNYPEGFREYEWRKRNPSQEQRNRMAPLWDGAPLMGKTILLHAEQGLGDTIQFCRFASSVAKLGGHIVLEVQRPLANLLKSVPGVRRVVARGDDLPEHQCQCPLMSVPYRLGTSVWELPATVPYLTLGAQRMAYWEARIDAVASEDEIRVGLAWSGNTNYHDNAKRSIPPELLEGLSGVPGIHWFGLQKDNLGLRIPGLALEWLESPATTFDDAASIVKSLDLIISVDTSIAHLAGALARPVWLLASHAPDWRWMRDREDSPWYPTMRIFRQSTAGKWRPVLGRIRDRLRGLVSDR